MQKNITTKTINTEAVTETTEAGAVAEIFATPATTKVPFTDEKDFDYEFEEAIYNRWMCEGYDIGFSDGIAEGLSKSNAEQYQCGYEEGYDTGMDDGYENAIEENKEKCKTAFDDGYKSATNELNEQRNEIWDTAKHVGYKEGYFDALERCIELLANKLLSASA